MDKQALMQQVENQAAALSDFLKEVSTSGMGQQRWLAIANTHMQQGFMALRRAIDGTAPDKM